ncbi:MAG: tetratricopeptide repeat protein [Terriglobia bacterium]
MAFHRAKALQEAEKSVAQGKVTHAIKQYLDILENDPSDVSLLNTVGDLYIRERNTAEALKHFQRLAEAYVREGFNVKAIAIYRKISKVDPNSVDTLLKLGELYQVQGLSREARDQYLQAAEFLKKRNQTERALEVFRKLVQIDPENVNFRNRLAAEVESTGKNVNAAQAYLESAEVLLHRDNHAAAETALKKAAELDPKNSKIQILRARVAIARERPGEAEKIINSSQELQSDPAAMRILLDSYLETRKLPEAEKLARAVFQANPADFAPVSSTSALLAEKGDVDKAYELLAAAAEPLINQNNAGPLLEALRRVLEKAPQHIPTLELTQRVCERTSDELVLSQVQEALGRAHDQAGDLEKAEAAYLKLHDRAPENATYRELLNAVQQKLGREIKPTDFSTREAPLVVLEESPAEPLTAEAKQEAVVKEALENSDLFARYNLPEKAIAELEKVLQIYPDQAEVHLRILEISRKGFPARGAEAAGQLARIYAERGDVETASKYQAMASGRGSLHETPLPAIALEKPVPAAPEAPPPEPVAFDLTPPKAPSEPPAASPPPPVIAGPAVELDLSGDLEDMTGFAPESPAPAVLERGASLPVEMPAPAEIPASVATPPPPPVAAPTAAHESPPAVAESSIPADLEDSVIEIDFYIENGFMDEARQAVAVLEDKYPGNSLVAELRRQLDEPAAEESPAEQVQVAPPEEAPVAEPPAEVVQAKPEVASPPEPAPAGEEPAAEEWELPETYGSIPSPEPVVQLAAPPPVAEPAAPPELVEVTTPLPAPMVETPAAAESGDKDLLGELAGEIASLLDESAVSADGPPATSTASSMAAATPMDPAQGMAQLSELLAEMEEPGDSMADKSDPETHYNLGVAFREMGLLDEAIGEFQKVVKGAGKGKYPPNFLQACSLLAICFMDKKMPAIAVKWYVRAQEAPDLDEEALMALQYDLGLAYEQAGDPRNALERFTEVYSQNIDFRNVAEKIRELQQRT